MSKPEKVNGVYPSYTEMGLYPLYYVTTDWDIICPDCANSERYQDTICLQAINWESNNTYCDDCNKRIGSAYAEQ